MTITWSKPERNEDSTNPEPNEGKAHAHVPALSNRGVAARAVTSNAPIGEQFRRQHEAMQRVLEPIRRQQEAFIAQTMSTQDDGAP